MLKVTAGAVLATLLLSSSATTAAAECVKVSVGSINVRMMPGGACLGSIKRNTKINVETCGKSWCHIAKTKTWYFSTRLKGQQTYAASKNCPSARPVLKRCVSN